jgi:hypothetical protein
VKYFAGRRFHHTASFVVGAPGLPSSPNWGRRSATVTDAPEVAADGVRRGAYDSAREHRPGWPEYAAVACGDGLEPPKHPALSRTAANVHPRIESATDTSAVHFP